VDRPHTTSVLNNHNPNFLGHTKIKDIYSSSNGEARIKNLLADYLMIELMIKCQCIPSNNYQHKLKTCAKMGII